MSAVVSAWTRYRRLLPGLTVALAVAVPAVSLAHMPRVSPWPVVLGLLPWLVGKYVLCPLRWHALSESHRSWRWHLRAYAEAELLGLLTPGHVGADIWRIRRLGLVGVARPAAIAEVGLDRLVGALGLVLFVAAAGVTLPPSLLAGAAGIALTLFAVGAALYRWRPGLLPRRPLPTRGQLARGIALSLGYQLSTCALLLGTVSATGHPLPPLALLGAFGASQLAGVIPGPQGASPKDGALVLGLVALGVPWAAAVGAVALKAVVAWAPALALGGAGLLLARRAAGATQSAGTPASPAAGLLSA